MAKLGRLTVTVTDYLGKSASVQVTVPESKATLANAKALASWMENHTAAAVSGYSATVPYEDSCIAGKYDRVLQRAEMLFENQDGRQVRFSIPAPKDNQFNDDQEVESDVPKDVIDLLIQVGAGSAFVYNGSGLKSRLGSKESRAKKLTGV